jgi:hypothetical protein
VRGQPEQDPGAELDQVKGQPDHEHAAGPPLTAGGLGEHGVGADQVDGQVEAPPVGAAQHRLADIPDTRVQRVVGAHPMYSAQAPS